MNRNKCFEFKAETIFYTIYNFKLRQMHTHTHTRCPTKKSRKTAEATATCAAHHQMLPNVNLPHCRTCTPRRRIRCRIRRARDFGVPSCAARTPRRLPLCRASERPVCRAWPRSGDPKSNDGKSEVSSQPVIVLTFCALERAVCGAWPRSGGPVINDTTVRHHYSH